MHGSGGKELAVQARGPEFTSPHPRIGMKTNRYEGLDG